MVLVLNLAEKENKSEMAALVTGSTDFDKMEDGLISWLLFFGLEMAVLFFFRLRRAGEEAAKMAVLALSGALLPSCGHSFRDSTNSFLTVFNAEPALGIRL